MTIDEAIGRIEDVIKMNEKVLETGIDEYGFSIDELYADDTEAIDKVTNFYKEAIGYHNQIVEWLKELKSYRGVLQEIREEIEQAAQKQFEIAMGVAHLDTRYTYLQKENCYRRCIGIIDGYIAEYTGDKE